MDEVKKLYYSRAEMKASARKCTFLLYCVISNSNRTFFISNLVGEFNIHNTVMAIINTILLLVLLLVVVLSIMNSNIILLLYNEY